MSDNDRQTELKINGHGSAAGGSFALVRINGHGKIEGDLQCSGAFTINGSGDAQGDVETGMLSVNGIAHFAGDVKAQTLKVKGTANFKADVTCEDVSVSGSADIKGSLSAQSAKVTGALWVEGDISAETFVASGSFKTDGLLSADKIDVRLHWSKSRASEIGGASITVRRSVGGLNAIRTLFAVEPLLEADVIEGNDINLEHTRAKVVRGCNVTLGSGCDIDVVEYTGVLKKSVGARVGEEKKV